MLEAAKQLLMSEASERREIAEFEEGKKNPTEAETYGTLCWYFS